MEVDIRGASEGVRKHHRRWHGAVLNETVDSAEVSVEVVDTVRVAGRRTRSVRARIGGQGWKNARDRDVGEEVLNVVAGLIDRREGVSSGVWRRLDKVKGRVDDLCAAGAKSVIEDGGRFERYVPGDSGRSTSHFATRQCG